MRWPLKALGELAQVSGGSTPSRTEDRYWHGKIPWVTPTDLPMPGTTIAEVTDTKDHISEAGLASISAPLLPAGTVLFSSRATIGKLGIAQVPLATNQGFANFEPKPGMDARFLAYALQFFTPQIASLAGSTTFKEISRGSIKKFKIPVPPPSEQRLIVKILDQADALRRLRADASAKAQRILPAIFLKMFGDPALNPKAWDISTIGSLASKMSDGPFGSNLKSEHYTLYGVRVFRLQNVRQGFLDNADQAFVSLDYFRTLQRHECLPGDVIVGTLGDPNLRAFVQPPEISRAINKADCVQVRVNVERATPEWLAWLLNMPGTLSLATRLVTGQSRTRISMGRLRNLRVPVPPLDMQKDFSHIAKAVGTLTHEWREAEDRTTTIREAMVHRVFSGDLTAKWRAEREDELLREMAMQAKALGVSLGYFELSAQARGRTGAATC